MDFQKLFSKIPEAIVVVSPDYKIVAASDAYLKLTMRSHSDIIGLHFLLEAFPDPAFTYEENPVRKSLDRALESKEVDYLDVIRYDIARSEAEGGGYYEGYWEASHTPVLDEQGNVEYLIQKTSDVTERERAKLAQQVSENKFKFMTDAVPQLIDTNDPDGTLTYFNQRWLDYTGLTIGELLDSPWEKVLHPDDLTKTINAWDTAFENGSSCQLEMRIRDKEGVYRWHLNRYLPMHDTHGNIHLWVCSSTDIHSTKLMVQELLSTNEQMSALSDQVQHAYEKAENERKTLERFIMQAPALFAIVKGPQHRFELVNPVYQQLFPHRELLHKTVAEALPEVIEQGFIQILDGVYNSGKAFVADEIKILLDRSNTGNLEDVYFNIIYQPLLEGDKITGIIAFGNEVTENVRLRQKLQTLGHA